MHSIAVFSQKGGSGKTTISVNLAAISAGDGKAVAVLDLDPQGSATLWKDIRDKEQPGVMAASFARLPKILEAARVENVDLVIMDVPPKAADAAVAACRVADMVLIPIEPEIYNLGALESAIDIARSAQKEPVIVINRASMAGDEVEKAIEVVKSYRAQHCPITLYQRKPVSQAQAVGLSVPEYVGILQEERRMRSNHENAALEMVRFYDWVTKAIGAKRG